MRRTEALPPGGGTVNLPNEGRDEGETWRSVYAAARTLAISSHAAIASARCSKAAFGRCSRRLSVTPALDIQVGIYDAGRLGLANHNCVRACRDVNELVQ